MISSISKPRTDSFFCCVVAPLYLAAFRRKNGAVQVIRQAVDEPNWYNQIVKNFSFPSTEEMHAPITATVGKCRNSNTS